MKGFSHTHGLQFSKRLRRMGIEPGETPLARIFHERDSFAYKSFRTKVFREQGEMCFICQSRPATQVHHLAMFSKNPDKRFDASNGRPVCARCHRKTRSFGGLKTNPPQASEDEQETANPD